MYRNIIIAVVIMLIVGLGAGAYFFFFSGNGRGAGETARTIRDFFPFGNPDTQAPAAPSDSIDDGGPDVAASDFGGFVSGVDGLELISAEPVAGAAFIDTGDATVIRYVERSTGNVYETAFGANTGRRVTNTTIPGMYETYWNAEGDGLLFRILDANQNDVRTLLATINQTMGTSTDEIGQNQLESEFLGANIEAVAVAPSRTQFIAMKDDGGVGVVVRNDFTGENENILTTLPLSEWVISWPTSDVVALATRPSALAAGYLYFANTSTGVLTKIMGNVPGLTALVSPDANTVLYSNAGDQSFSLLQLNRETGATAPLPVRTLPEKCVWSNEREGVVYCAVPGNIPAAIYPDAWYQGAISFSDQLWEINLETGNTALITSLEVPDIPSSLGVLKSDEVSGVDAVDLQIDQDEEHVLFTNKTDGTLWSVRINNTAATSTQSGS